MDYYKKSVYDKIDCKFANKIYEYNNQLRILTRDWGINKFNRVFINQTQGT